MSRPSTTNKAMLAAYDQGLRDRRRGMPHRNPYGTAKCKRRNGGAWNAVYRNYWARGWADGVSVPRQQEFSACQ